MKLLRPLFVLGLLLSSLSACSTGNTGSDNYLTPGETATTGELSQTVKRLDYLPPPSTMGLSDNERAFELEYVLHSDYETIVALGSISCYSAVFDGNVNNGGLYYGLTTPPNSIAPKENKTILLRMKCFSDWKTVVISYKDNNNNAYTFSLRSSDYPDYANNCYPTLKQNDSFVSEDGKAKIAFKSLKTTTIGSAHAGVNSDNLEFVVSLTSFYNENISIPSSTYRYAIKCDAGFTSASFSVASPSLPTSLPANGTVDLTFIIVLSKEWKKMVFGCDDGVTYKFTILHSNISY